MKRRPSRRLLGNQLRPLGSEINEGINGRQLGRNSSAFVAAKTLPLFMRDTLSATLGYRFARRSVNLFKFLPFGTTSAVHLSDEG